MEDQSHLTLGEKRNEPSTMGERKEKKEKQTNQKKKKKKKKRRRQKQPTASHPSVKGRDPRSVG